MPKTYFIRYLQFFNKKRNVLERKIQSAKTFFISAALRISPPLQVGEAWAKLWNKCG